MELGIAVGDPNACSPLRSIAVRFAFSTNVAFTTVFSIPGCQPDVCPTVLVASWFATNMDFIIARCQLAACPDFAGATFLLEKSTNGVPGRQPDVCPSVEFCVRRPVLIGKSV